MWKRLWQTWTVDKPAAIGDLLWDVLVVQFAAFLDRLTVRQMVAFISSSFSSWPMLTAFRFHPN